MQIIPKKCPHCMHLKEPLTTKFSTSFMISIGSEGFQTYQKSLDFTTDPDKNPIIVLKNCLQSW